MRCSKKCRLRRNTKRRDETVKAYWQCSNEAVEGSKYCSHHKLLSERSKQRYVEKHGIEVVRERRRKYQPQITASRQELRKRVVAAYGGKCACCGESESKFLALDHKNGLEGKRRRIGYIFYRELENEGYPDYMQLLCHNCNVGRSLNNGICPHAENWAL